MNMDKTNNQRKYILDLFKFIAVLFVVILHIPSASKFGFVIHNLSQFAVPFFLICIGYFVYIHVDQIDYLKRQILKLFKYYVFGWVLYQFFHLFLDFYTGSLDMFFENFTENIFSILWFPHNAQHLWFIISSIYSLIILYFFIRIEKTKLLYTISIFLFVIGSILSFLGKEFTFIPYWLFLTTPFYALPFITLGYASQIIIKKLSLDSKKSFILGFLSFDILAVSSFLHGFKDYLSISIFASFFLFSFLIQTKKEFPSSYQKLGEYVFPIYIFHFIPIYIIELFPEITFGYKNGWNQPFFVALIRIIIVIVTTLIISKIYFIVKKHFKK